jgi:hypothetical protein
MTNMREYWAREAEMMRDKSGVLGTRDDSVNDNQDNIYKNLDTLDIPKGVRYTAEIKILDEPKKILQVDFNIIASIKVIKCTTSGFDIFQANAFLPDLKSFLEKIYHINYSIEDYPFSHYVRTGGKLKKSQNWQIKCNFKSSYSINVVDSFNQISSSDLIIVIVDTVGPTSVSESGFSGSIMTGGFHQAGSRIMVLPKSTVLSKKNDAIRTIAHEEGHRLGLTHDHNSGGIMSYKTLYSSSDISLGQKKGLAYGAFYNPYSALKFKIGKFSVSPTFGDAKTEVTNWLDEAKGQFSGISYKIP